MHSRKPHVVVFFGGQASNADLSQESALWFGNYVPRSKYQITPVYVLPDGTWQVPLGSLPATGPIQTMWQRLFQVIKPLSPAKALERLLSRPVDLMMTFIRGKGGDDGSLHILGQTLQLPVFGSPATTSQHASNKYMAMKTIGEIANVPYTRLFKSHVPEEEILADMSEVEGGAFMVKPVAQEGSFGVSHAGTQLELLPALRSSRGQDDVLVQEHRPGTEISVTLYQDDRGVVQALPPTIILPKKTLFYDHAAKRHPGRVQLHTPQTQDNYVIAEAEDIARDIWDEMGCQDVACFDMVAGDDSLDVIEVNTVPTFTTLTPTISQLKTAGLHPSRMFDQFIRRNLR
jgi:D-alanine-D-alanine ligase